MTIDEKRPTRRRLLTGAAVLGGAAAAGPALSGCGQPAEAAGRTTIDYWLWDANQLPGYTAAIAAFEKRHPDIRVRVTQLGWDDYWTKLTASFVAESAPDAFTNHLGRYPEQKTYRVIAPLDGHPDIDAIAPDHFQSGLQKLWTGQDGKRYGMPKDFDTIALLYDRRALTAAGLSPADLADLDWNPGDGGSFEKVIAHLSVDRAGRRGDEPGFDRAHVATYGLAAPSGIDYVGQTSWSAFAFSTGWNFTDAETWGTRFRYDDPALAATVDWYFGLVDKGFFPPYGMFGDTSPSQTQVQAEKAAIAIDGSWMIGTYAGLDGVDLGIAPLPKGPIGTPMSMFNGLGDSISAQSEHPAEAARLVAFLASEESQRIIGGRGVVFPSTPAGTQAAVQAYAAKGIDAAPFTDRVNQHQTGLYPLVEHSAQISTIMQTAFDQLWLRRIHGADLVAFNDRVNALFR